MYGVKDNAIFQLIIGAELIQVCFGQNDLLLNFLEDIAITVLVDIGLTESDFLPVHPNSASHFFVSLLGKKISDVVLLDEKTIEIKFNDAVFQIKDDSEQFESMSFRFKDQLVVI